MCPIYYGVKDQGLNVLITENSLSHNCYPFTHITMKLHTQTPYEMMCPIDFGVKGQGHNALISENGNWHIISFYTYHHRTSYADCP